MFVAKSLIVFVCALVVVRATGVVPVFGGLGAPAAWDVKEAETYLTESLNLLSSANGPIYSVEKVHSATSQVVSGSAYKIKADIKDIHHAIKTCDISIWSRSWIENGEEITFECENEAKAVHKYNRKFHDKSVIFQ